MNKLIEVLEAKWLILMGLVIIVAGFVDLIWTQINAVPGIARIPAGYRWAIATGPIEVIALGVLILVGAQIMVAVQDAFLRFEGDNPELPKDDERSPDA